MARAVWKSSRDAGLVSGLYMLVFEKRVVFCGDTTINIDPTAEQIAQIAYAASWLVRTLGITPRIAMLSFSNFGSVRHPDTDKVARAVELLVRAPLDDGDVHARQRQLARQHQPRRTSPNDHHGMLGHSLLPVPQVFCIVRQISADNSAGGPGAGRKSPGVL